MLIIVLAISVAGLTACDVKPGKVTNVVNNFEYSHIVLKEKESVALNISDIFKNSGISITSCKIKSSTPEIVSIFGGKLTAKSSGQTDLSVALYSSATDTQYTTTFAKVYVIIEKDFQKISSAKDLIALQSKRSGNFILTQDIDLSGVSWQPIGNYPAGNSFSGMFVNLNNFKIKNLTISSTVDIYKGPYGGCAIGLFGSTTNSFFYGLNLENVRLNGSDFTPEYGGSTVGGISASSAGDTFYNCSVQGTLSSTSITGGLVGGSSRSRFIGCEFIGVIEDSIKGTSQCGSHGIAGYVGGGRIVNCKVNAYITGSRSAGFIAGWCETFGGLYKDNITEGDVLSPTGNSLAFGSYLEKPSLSGAN